MVRRLAVVAFLLAAALSASLFWAQPSAVHEGPRYAEAAESDHGRAIAEARSIIYSRMDEFPGLSVAVGINGTIVWSEGFGWADVEQRVPVRPSSKFRVGSVAKPMTTALLALVLQNGAIDLDAPVHRYVPSFPEKRFPITTRQLAGHLAGIRHYQGNEFLSSRHYPTVSEGLEIFQNDPLLFEPGTQYSYSSYGYNLISAVIEGATGEDFLTQMADRVFEPLGMRHTSADQNRLIVFDRVRPYGVDDEGRFVNAPHVDNSYKWAGGGFVSTTEDLVRFGFGHLEPGFLEASTLAVFQSSQKTRDGEETGYGLGWRAGTDDEGRRIVGHGGGSVGGTTSLRLYPDERLVIAIVTNLSRAPTLPVGEIAELFLE